MWPILLSIFELVGVFGMWQAGRGRWWGWLVVMLHSWPWALYALQSDQPGFLFMFAMWQLVNGYNAGKWFHRRRHSVLNLETANRQS